MNEKISVIIPIYKVEKYLDRCIESVVKQSYQNLEIILVDDGSPDNCPKMCDEWAKKDNRIVVIHKENGGLSDARNAGVAIATGNYIGFVDSDDWIHPDMYATLYSEIINNNADMASCGVEMVWDDINKNMSLTNSGSYVLDTEEAMKSIILETKLKQVVWNKLYRKNIVQEIKFPVGKVHEDVYWSYKVIGNASRIVVYDTMHYYYRQRENSIMGKSYSIKRLYMIEAKLERHKYVEKKYPEIAVFSKVDLLFSCVYHQQMIFQYLTGNESRLATEYIKMIYKKIKIDYADWKVMSTKQKIWQILLKIDFNKVCKLRNKLNIGI